MGMVLVSRHRNRLPEILEFHDLNVWDPGYGYDRVRMNQAIRNRRVHDPLTYKVEHVRANHQYYRLCQAYNRAAVEL